MGKNSKKRRKENGEGDAYEQFADDGSSLAYLDDPYHPQRPYTITIAVAGTVLDNAVSPQRKAYLAGQIARAIAIFNVDEVLVFSDQGTFSESHGCTLMALLLHYLECPPYLKKNLFKLESDLQYAGLIPPLCLPHHFSKDDVVPYRDGITTNQPGLVDVGLTKKIHCEVELLEGIRVTVKIQNPEAGAKGGAKVRGEIVPPTEPRKTAGIYWGYKVSTVESVIEVLENKKYDCIIGTSDKGSRVTDLGVINRGEPFKNMLIVFGGVDGLESAVGFENDTETSFRERFTHYINVRPSQGTKTIRTEEAIPLTLGALEPTLREYCAGGKKGKHRTIT